MYPKPQALLFLRPPDLCLWTVSPDIQLSLLWGPVGADDDRLALGRGHGLLFSWGSGEIGGSEQTVTLLLQQAWLVPEPRAPTLMLRPYPKFPPAATSSRVYLSPTPHRILWASAGLQAQPQSHSLDDRWRAEWILGDTNNLVQAAQIAPSCRVEVERACRAHRQG